MEENGLWAVFMKCVAAVVIGLIGTVGGCTAYESHLISDAVKGGADPVAARCGITGTANSGADQCLVLAARKQ